MSTTVALGITPYIFASDYETGIEGEIVTLCGSIDVYEFVGERDVLTVTASSLNSMFTEDLGRLVTNINTFGTFPNDNNKYSIPHIAYRKAFGSVAYSIYKDSDDIVQDLVRVNISDSTSSPYTYHVAKLETHGLIGNGYVPTTKAEVNALISGYDDTNRTIIEGIIDNATYRMVDGNIGFNAEDDYYIPIAELFPRNWLYKPNQGYSKRKIQDVLTSIPAVMEVFGTVPLYAFDYQSNILTTVTSLSDILTDTDGAVVIDSQYDSITNDPSNPKGEHDYRMSVLDVLEAVRSQTMNKVVLEEIFGEYNEADELNPATLTGGTDVWSGADGVLGRLSALIKNPQQLSLMNRVVRVDGDTDAEGTVGALNSIMLLPNTHPGSVSVKGDGIAFMGEYDVETGTAKEEMKPVDLFLYDEFLKNRELVLNGLLVEEVCEIAKIDSDTLQNASVAFPSVFGEGNVVNLKKFIKYYITDFDGDSSVYNETAISLLSGKDTSYVVDTLVEEALRIKDLSAYGIDVYPQGATSDADKITLTDAEWKGILLAGAGVPSTHQMSYMSMTHLANALATGYYNATKAVLYSTLLLRNQEVDVTPSGTLNRITVRQIHNLFDSEINNSSTTDTFLNGLVGTTLQKDSVDIFGGSITLTVDAGDVLNANGTKKDTTIVDDEEYTIAYEDLSALLNTDNIKTALANDVFEQLSGFIDTISAGSYTKADFKNGVDAILQALPGVNPTLADTADGYIALFGKIIYDVQSVTAADGAAMSASLYSLSTLSNNLISDISFEAAVNSAGLITTVTSGDYSKVIAQDNTADEFHSSVTEFTRLQNANYESFYRKFKLLAPQYVDANLVLPPRYNTGGKVKALLTELGFTDDHITAAFGVSGDYPSDLGEQAIYDKTVANNLVSGVENMLVENVGAIKDVLNELKINILNEAVTFSTGVSPLFKSVAPDSTVNVVDVKVSSIFGKTNVTPSSFSATKVYNETGGYSGDATSISAGTPLHVAIRESYANMMNVLANDLACFVNTDMERVWGNPEHAPGSKNNLQTWQTDESLKTNFTAWLTGNLLANARNTYVGVELEDIPSKFAIVDTFQTKFETFVQNSYKDTITNLLVDSSGTNGWAMIAELLNDSDLSGSALLNGQKVGDAVIKELDLNTIRSAAEGLLVRDGDSRSRDSPFNAGDILEFNLIYGNGVVKVLLDKIHCSSENAALGHTFFESAFSSTLGNTIVGEEYVDGKSLSVTASDVLYHKADGTNVVWDVTGSTSGHIKIAKNQYLTGASAEDTYKALMFKCQIKVE